MFKAQTKNNTYSKLNNSSPFQNGKANTPFIQPKLNIGQPGDKYEVEADRVADQVVANTTNTQTESSFFTPSTLVQNKVQGNSNTQFFEGQTSLVQTEAEEEELQLAEKEQSKDAVPEQIQETSEPDPIALNPEPVSVQLSVANSSEELIQEQEEEEEEPIQTKSVIQKIENAEVPEEETQLLQAKSDSGGSHTSIESDLNNSAGGGSSMSDSTKSEMESGFGTDFSNVNIHTDSNAVQMNQNLGAQAFTHGNDIYFNEGKYQPESDSGKHLLAHELTHTVQQGGASLKRKQNISSTTDNLQGAWYNVDIPYTNYYFDPSYSGVKTAASLTFDNIKYTNPVYWHYRAAKWGMNKALNNAEKIAQLSLGKLVENEVVELKGKDSFQPSLLHKAYIYSKAVSKESAKVKVRFGDMAKGKIKVWADLSTQTFTADSHAIPMNHPGLEIDTKKEGLALQFKVKTSKVTGRMGVVRGIPQAQLNALMAQAVGFENNFLDKDMFHAILGDDYDRGDLMVVIYTNKLSGGVLTLTFGGSLKLGGGQNLIAGFVIINDSYAWEGRLGLKVKGLDEKEMKIMRDDEGQLFGDLPSINLQGEWKTSKGFVSAGLNASFIKGVIDIRGDVEFKSDRLSGTLTLLVTDENLAREMAQQNLPAEVSGGKESGEPATASESKSLGITGWGVLNVIIAKRKDGNDLLTGDAAFVVDPDGYVTVKGTIRVEPVLELTKQYPESPEWEPRFDSLEWTRYLPIPPYGWLKAKAEGGLYTKYIVHPLILHKIAVTGIYSTNSEIENTISITAQLNGFAEAFGKIDISGYIAYLSKHLASVGFNFIGEAKLGGGFEVEPTIGMAGKSKEKDKKVKNSFPEFMINGKIVIGGLLDVNLKGSLNVELLTGKFEKRVIDLNRHIGSFGLHADFEHEFGGEFKPIVNVKKGNFERRAVSANVLRLYDKGKSAKSDERTGGFYEEGKQIGGIDAVKPAVKDEEQLPVTQLTDSFEMEGKDHSLYLFIGEPGMEAELIMATNPEELINKIEIAKIKLGEKKALVFDDEKLAELDLRVKELNRIKKAAAGVLNSAKKLGVDPSSPGRTKIPGFKQLSNMIATYGNQYGVNDISGQLSPDEEPPGTKKNPFEIVWPKPPTVNYPTLYFGGPLPLDEPRSQGIQRGLFKKGQSDSNGYPIKEYKPHSGGTLPGGEKIGLSETYRIYKFKIIGPLSNDTTKKGYIINNILKKYGYLPGRNGHGMDGDHVWEIQFGGKNVVENLWPLDSDINQLSGTTLDGGVVAYPNTGKKVKIRELKKRVKNYYFKITGFDY